MVGVHAFASLRRDGRRLLGCFLLFFCSSFGQTFFVSVFGEHIRTEHGLSHGAYGGLYTAATLIGAVALAKAGRVVDVRPAWKVVSTAFAFLAVGALLMALSDGAVLLFAGLVLLRFFGQGMLTHTSFTLVGRWFSRERGRAASIATLGLSAGEAFLPALGIACVAAVGWRPSWIVATLTLVTGGTAVTLLFRRERPPRESAVRTGPDGAGGWTRAQALRDRYFYVVLLATLTPALVGNTFFFHQAYLVELRGWSLGTTVSAMSVYATVTVLTNMGGGWLVDRFSALVLLPYFLLPAAGGLVIVSSLDAQWSVLVFFACFGATNGLSLTLFGAVLPEIYGTGHLGAIRSAVVTVVVFAAAAGPGLSGMLIDLGVGYAGQLFSLGVYCVVISAALVRAVPRIQARTLPGTTHAGRDTVPPVTAGHDDRIDSK